MNPAPTAPIPFITLPNWVQAATLCGFNIQPVFDAAGVRTDLVPVEEATITVPQLVQVMEGCVARSREAHFPFVLGEVFAFDYLPDINVFLTTSPNLRDAARVLEWVRALVNPTIRFRLDEQGESASLVLVSSMTGGAVQSVERYFIESIFASVVKFGRLLGGSAIERQARLRFRHPAPPYAERYARYFPMPVQFGQADNALDLPRALLDQPLSGAFPQLHAQAEQRVHQRLDRQRRRTGVIGDVEAAFERDPGLLGQGIEAMAARLGLHPRTLQRRLRDQGESFGELQDRVRYRMALHDLRASTLDLDTISERLGFSDRRSFTRAFSRWAGLSPSEYRRRSRSA